MQSDYPMVNGQTLINICTTGGNVISMDQKFVREAIVSSADVIELNATIGSGVLVSHKSGDTGLALTTMGGRWVGLSPVHSLNINYSAIFKAFIQSDSWVDSVSIDYHSIYTITFTRLFKCSLLSMRPMAHSKE